MGSSMWLVSVSLGLAVPGFCPSQTGKIDFPAPQKGGRALCQHWGEGIHRGCELRGSLVAQAQVGPAGTPCSLSASPKGTARNLEPVKLFLSNANWKSQIP